MTKKEQKYLEYLWKVLGGLMESKELLLLFIYYTVYLWGKSFAFAEDCGGWATVVSKDFNSELPRMLLYPFLLFWHPLHK